MPTLYIIRGSVGAPRQRVYRSSFRVLASGTTELDARRRAVTSMGDSLRAGHVARVESAERVCETPDLFCIPGPY